MPLAFKATCPHVLALMRLGCLTHVLTHNFKNHFLGFFIFLFLFTGLYVYHVCTVPAKARRGRQLLGITIVTKWMLGIEPQSSGKTASAFNH